MKCTTRFVNPYLSLFGYTTVCDVYIQEFGLEVYSFLASDHAALPSGDAHKHRNRFPQGNFFGSLERNPPE